MRAVSVLVLLATMAGASASVAHHGQKESPIQKVISMLTDMLAKGKKEKQDETVRFAAFKQFCESTAAEKTKDIANAKAELEQLDAEISKAAADVQVLGKQIAGLDSDMATWSADLKRTAAERKKEHAAYEEAHAEYVSSISAVSRAMGMLQKGPGGKAIEQSMLQETLHPEKVFELLQLPEKMRPQAFAFIQKISPDKALLQEAEDEGIMVDAPVNPQAKAFEGSSGGVIDLVERLGEKFEDEKRALEKAEANALSAYQLMSADLTAQVAAAGDEKGTKESTKATRTEEGAEAKGDFADTSASLAEDEKYLSDLNKECEAKSFDYQQRQIVRQGEIEAITKAIEIMGTAASVDPRAAAAMMQGSMSLAQLRSSVHSPVQDSVATFLNQKADKIGSRLLALLASKAASDPFTKVKKMIKDMITKLMEEANAEAEHKAFCDTEMNTNKQTRDKKTEVSETLAADIEELTADIAKLATEITELGAQVAEIDAATAKATEDRNEEKAKNQATLSDAKMGAEAVANALAVLKEFYEKAAVPVEQPAPQQGPIAWDNKALQILKNGGASAAALVQTHKKAPSLLQVSADKKGKVPGAPEMEEGAYTGMGNGGVLGLMEVCQSDFEKIIATTMASETEAQKDFETFIADSKQDKAVKLTDQGHKTNSKTEKESNLATAKKDLRITQDELHAAMQYYEKLKPDCEVKAMSYEEKVAQRKAEIESLQEALEILAGENI